jgi:hypothetical protein
MNKYAILIQKLVKLSNVKPDQLEIDRADSTKVNLLIKNSATGEMLPFAQYDIEKSFIDFLSSGDADGWNIPSINDLTQYFKTGSLMLVNDPENVKAEQIPEYLRGKKYAVPLKVEFRRRALNATPHDTALELFTSWLKKPKPSGSPSPAY